MNSCRCGAVYPLDSPEHAEEHAGYEVGYTDGGNGVPPVYQWPPIGAPRPKPYVEGYLRGYSLY